MTESRVRDPQAVNEQLAQLLDVLVELQAADSPDAAPVTEAPGLDKNPDRTLARSGELPDQKSDRVSQTGTNGDLWGLEKALMPELQKPGFLGDPSSYDGAVARTPVSSPGASEELKKPGFLESPSSYDGVAARTPVSSEETEKRRGRLQTALQHYEMQEKLTAKPVTPPSPPQQPPPPSSKLTKVEQRPNSEEQAAMTLRQAKDLASLLAPWQDSEVDDKVAGLQQTIVHLNQKLEHLQTQVYQPTELIDPLLPLISELLKGKVHESEVNIFDAMVPVIDRVIMERTQQDRKAMSSALSVLIPEAISQHIHEAPDDIAQAIGPAMGRAIKEQIRLERDAMVDALYPVIGNTISKYMGEVVREINAKVENTLSMEGVQRKFRAKMQGVSEAELILRESSPFTVKAVFLIHKASGLVISEVQPSEDERLESEMIAGMLTAIRSFASECVAPGGNVSELNEIEYDNFKLLLEVAGYCYVAVVSQGVVPKEFIKKLRGTLSTIVENYDKQMEGYDGDSDAVPPQIYPLLLGLIWQNTERAAAEREQKKPISLLAIAMVVLLGMGVWSIGNAFNARTEAKVMSALAEAPELSVYRLSADAGWGKVRLEGKLPNQRLRQKAGLLAANAVPKKKIENHIIAVKVPPDRVLAQAEVQRVTALLNQMLGIDITTTYAGSKVIVEGKVHDVIRARQILKAFDQIPGVDSALVGVQLQELTIASRIYFAPGAASLNLQEAKSQLEDIKSFLEVDPTIMLRVVGHTDPSGSPEINQKLAMERASSVRQALMELGVAGDRLQVAGYASPPVDLKSEDPLWMSRCVRFEAIPTGVPTPETKPK